MTRTTAGQATALLAVVVVLAGCSSPPGAAPSATAPTPTTTALPTPVVEVPIVTATPPPARRSAPPVRVVVTTIGADVPVLPVGVETGGFMELPVDPAVAGWYRFGADPSSADGNIVISAHVDAPQYPIGPFSRLRELPPGASIEVTDASDTLHRYTVESVTYYPKTELPVDELFARDGARNLVLITCGGEFDARTGRYADNVVVIATPRNGP
ncbi:class F sortase [Microbacterium sp. CFH 31415]|uniref:class F sortase n=1 Tax=Microbacterium sp. CFH 31415 TaxID=2921732 RepID=UPI001F145CEC|nr:class F sortase [Microbacterium sp. CFH 31415]MCH6229211.1 class F sortase [Microbacterium sp. CFH 31415]